MSEWHESDSVHVEGLDTEAFGVSRSAMRDALAADSISKLIQMFVGASPPPGVPQMQFGLAGPEVG